MSKVSECSNSSQLQQNQEMIFAEEEVEDVGGEQEVVQGDAGRGGQDARLQLQILLSQVDKSFLILKQIFAGDWNSFQPQRAKSLLNLWTCICQKIWILLMSRRITHSFKEGEEFRKDEDIHKWGPDWKNIVWADFTSTSLHFGVIGWKSESQVFGVCSDQLGHAEAAGFHWRTLQSKVSTLRGVLFLNPLNFVLQGDATSWEAFKLRQRRQGGGSKILGKD